MRKFVSLYVTLTVLLLVGCAAKPSLVRVKSAPAIGQPFAGVPMRLKTPQVVEVYRLNTKTDSYELVKTLTQNMADQEHLYAVDVVAGPFSSPALHIAEYADNTPKSIEVTTSNNSSGAIDAVTTGLTGYETARSTRETSCQSSNSAVLTADQAVASAQAAYDGLNSTASQALRTAYRQELVNAQTAAEYAHKNPLCN